MYWSPKWASSSCTVFILQKSWLEFFCGWSVHFLRLISDHFTFLLYSREKRKRKCDRETGWICSVNVCVCVCVCVCVFVCVCYGNVVSVNVFCLLWEKNGLNCCKMFDHGSSTIFMFFLMFILLEANQLQHISHVLYDHGGIFYNSVCHVWLKYLVQGWCIFVSFTNTRGWFWAFLPCANLAFSSSWMLNLKNR